MLKNLLSKAFFTTNDKVVFQKEIKVDEKTFQTMNEAKQYLKTRGLSETEIHKIDEEIKKAGQGNIQFTAEKTVFIPRDKKQINTTTTSSLKTCPRCHRTFVTEGEYCPNCQKIKKVPFLKRIFNLE